MTLAEALAGQAIPPLIRPTLVLVDIEHWSFDDRPHQGQLVVHQDLAAEVGAIFDEILAVRFPIARMIPVAHYGWSDDASMADNNSSAFNYRLVTDNSKMSWHAYGRAIDINPRLNPYVQGEIILPPGASYDPTVPGTLAGDGLAAARKVVAAFEARGWEWGGRWTEKKDWHHFQKPTSIGQ